MAGKYDLKNTIPALATALQMPLESVAVWCQLSTTQLRRYLGSKSIGATEELKEVHAALKVLESFRDRCPVPVEFRRVEDLQALRDRLKKGDARRVVQEFYRALCELDPDLPQDVPEVYDFGSMEQDLLQELSR